MTDDDRLIRCSTCDARAGVLVWRRLAGGPLSGQAYCDECYFAAARFAARSTTLIIDHDQWIVAPAYYDDDPE